MNNLPIDVAAISIETSFELSRLSNLADLLEPNSTCKNAFFWHVRRTQQLTERIGKLSRRAEKDLLDAHKLTRLIDSQPEGLPENTCHSRVLESDESAIFRASIEAWDFLVSDIESLYETTSNLLDQWAFLVCCISGTRRRNFQRLLKDCLFSDQKIEMPSCNLYESLNIAIGRDLLWLVNHVKIFRDNFIVHHESPLEQATQFFGGNSGDLQVSLSFTAPVGWYEDEEKAAAENEALHIYKKTPEHLRVFDSDSALPSNTILSYCLEIIEEFDKADREKLCILAKKLGFRGPAFQTIVERACRMIAASVPILSKFCREEPAGLKNMQKTKLFTNAGPS